MSNYQFGIICRTCGPVQITEADYERQMNFPDAKWRCPLCRGSAEWDEDCLETNPPEEKLKL